MTEVVAPVVLDGQKLLLIADDIRVECAGQREREFVPGEGVEPSALAPVTSVGIGIQQGEWFLHEPDTRARLFSFDLPPDLFELYAREGVVSRERAVDLKAEYLSEIHAVITDEGQIRIIRFTLDPGWLERVRAALP